MSRASERKRMREGLAGYSLMGATEVAGYLGCSPPTARDMIKDGTIPSVQVGQSKKVDPITLAVYAMSQEAGITAEEFWKKHGEATPEHAARWFRARRKFKATTAA